MHMGVIELAKMLPKGTRIRLVSMSEDPDPVQPGTEGTVRGHGEGQVWIDWDSGRTLNLIPEVDKWEVIGKA